MNDLIYRKQAIDAVDLTTWYHQSKNGEMVEGANSKEHQAWFKADDIYNVLNNLPSAKPFFYGHSIEHLALIATIMQKEGVTPEIAIEYFTNIDRMYRMIIEEEKDLLNRALGWAERKEAK